MISMEQKVKVANGRVKMKKMESSIRAVGKIMEGSTCGDKSRWEQCVGRESKGMSQKKL